jgi:hypothetical protein
MPYISTFDGNISQNQAFYNEKPKKTSMRDFSGLKRLDPKNDIFFDKTLLTYNGLVLTSETDSITSFTTHSNSSNSGYAYSIASALLKYDIISKIPLTGTSTALNYTFRGNNTDQDIVADTKLGIGKIALIGLKKSRFGTGIKESTFTANIGGNITITDSISASDSHGYLKYSHNGYVASAGVIFYELGIAAVFGPSLSAINSISSLSSIAYSSETELNTLTVFCNAKENEFNYSTNENAFYKTSVTSDPNSDSSTGITDFTVSGYQWGTTGTNRSMYYLKDTHKRTPFITTVGLYNEDNQLLMVAKLAQPITKPQNIPITIKINYDF